MVISYEKSALSPVMIIIIIITDSRKGVNSTFTHFLEFKFKKNVSAVFT